MRKAHSPLFALLSISLVILSSSLLHAQASVPSSSSVDCHSKQTPNIVLWYGWSEMQRDLTEIRELADQMRRDKKSGPTMKPAAKLKPASQPSH